MHCSQKCQPNFICRIFLTSDHVTGSMTPSGILESGLSFTFKQLEEIMVLVYALGTLPWWLLREARGKNDIGHLATTTMSILKCLEIADYRVFSSCSCQLCLTEFSVLVDLCYICLFQRPGSLEQKEPLTALLPWKLPIVFVPFCELGFFESQVPAVGVEPLKMWTFSYVEKSVPWVRKANQP